MRTPIGTSRRGSRSTLPQWRRCQPNTGTPLAQRTSATMMPKVIRAVIRKYTALMSPKSAIEESFQYSGPTAVHRAIHRQAATASAQRATQATVSRRRWRGAAETAVPVVPWSVPVVPVLVSVSGASVSGTPEVGLGAAAVPAPWAGPDAVAPEAGVVAVFTEDNSMRHSCASLVRMLWPVPGYMSVGLDGSVVRQRTVLSFSSCRALLASVLGAVCRRTTRRVSLVFCWVLGVFGWGGVAFVGGVV